MILMDSIGHLISTKHSGELHTFAQRLGLLRKWFQPGSKEEWHAHYDLTTHAMKNRAEALGARLVSSESLIRLAWWNPSGLMPHEKGDSWDG